MNAPDAVRARVIVGGGVWVSAPLAAAAAQWKTRERRGVAPDRPRSDARREDLEPVRGEPAARGARIDVTGPLPARRGAAPHG